MANEDTVDARPIKEGKDPLSEGNTLVNPDNTEDHNTYEVLETAEGVRQAEINAARMVEEYHTAPTAAPARVRVRPNKSEAELADTIKTAKRVGR